MHNDFNDDDAMQMALSAYIWPYMLSPAEIAAAERKREWEAMSDSERAKCLAVDRSKPR